MPLVGICAGVLGDRHPYRDRSRNSMMTTSRTWMFFERYEHPYNPAEPVICLDEKPITLHAEVRSASAAEPDREARRDSEYKRCGTANVFCAVEPKAGRHFTFATPDRRLFSSPRWYSKWPCRFQILAAGTDAEAGKELKGGN